jgi:SAM-dependent methyltransferase
MRTIDYEFWAKYILSILPDRDKNAKVLELSAGTGSLSQHLSKKFKYYVISDKSLNMLKEIKFKSSRIVCSDFLALPFKIKFDIIISTFDSVNYILRLKDLQKFFKEIYNSLTDEGIFTFDAGMIENSKESVKLLNRAGSDKGIRFKQKSRFNEKKSIHTNSFSILLDEAKYIKEIHRQKIFSFENYFFSIEKAGLYVMDCYEAFTKKQGNETSKRLQFLLKKVK